MAAPLETVSDAEGFVCAGEMPKVDELLGPKAEGAELLKVKLAEGIEGLAVVSKEKVEDGAELSLEELKENGLSEEEAPLLVLFDPNVNLGGSDLFSPVAPVVDPNEKELLEEVGPLLAMPEPNVKVGASASLSWED